VLFLGPGEGVIVGEHARDNDLDLDITKEEKLAQGPLLPTGRDDVCHRYQAKA